MEFNDIENYLAEHGEEVSGEGFPAFVKKMKLRLSVPLIHVAGSNGKSETVFYLARMYGTSYKVGALFNSYLLSFREAIEINGESIPEDKATAYFNEAYPLIEKFHLTTFEVLVYLAYRYFSEEKVDLAIVECGMGGTFDPTNIEGLSTELSIFTNFALEHTEYLGTTLSEIAFSSSGIIKKEVPVLVGKMDDGALSALTEVAVKNKTGLNYFGVLYLPHLVNGNEFHFDYHPFKDLVIDGFASYNVVNACLAVEATKLLQHRFPLSEEKMREGLKAPALKGRLERHGDVVLDSASNPEAIDALRKCFLTAGKGKPVHVLFAAKTEENISVMIPYLADEAGEVALTTFDHPRARDEFGYALYTEDHKYYDNPLMAIMSLQMNHPGETVLATGCREFIAYLSQRL